MIVELVSFDRPFSLPNPYLSSTDSNHFRSVTINLINNSKADMIVFCGGTLKNYSDVVYVCKHVTNHNIIAILEAWEDSSKSLVDDNKPQCEDEEISEVELIRNTADERQLVKELHKITGLRNRVYKIEGGTIKPLGHHQVLVRSRYATKQCINLLLEELTYRKFTCMGKNCLVLQCGEINILRNVRSNGNEAEFRYNSDKAMTSKACSIYNDTDLFVNIIHTPMGEQGVLAKRREFLSRGNKVYVSTCNTDEISVHGKSLQYACKSGIQLLDKYPIIDKKNHYIIRRFTI